MPTFQAWQHIYSNVEKEQSPQGRGGFQTLFYTRSGLTEAEVEEMESRLLYFPSKVEPVKRLFFTTSTGKGVVAQIVFLPQPDQYGRGGRYLAHSLVFAPETLAQFEADPFRVFRRFSFITTVAEALAQGDFQSGDIPPVSLDLPAQLRHDVEAAGHWSRAELKKLALLALQVDRQTRERNAVTFAGDPAQIESALEAAFLVIPTSVRSRCIFDTYFYRCNLVATYFWAIGLPEPPIRAKFALVTAQSQQVRETVPGQPETAYERWALAAVEANQLAEIARNRNNAFALGEWLDGRKYDLSLLEAASSELITAVFKVNPQPVKATLRRQASKHLPPALVDRVAEYLHQQTSETTLYRHLRQGFELPQLLDILYDSYAAQQFREPPREEVKALAALLAQTDHVMLRLFWAYWSNPRKLLPRQLELVDEATYRQFGTIALRLKLVEPFNLLRPGRAETFLDLYLASGGDDLPELVEALIEVKETACLARLTSYVPKLSEKELKKLAGLIDKQPNIPEPFQVALEQAIAALPPKKGVKGVLRAVWRRLPGRESGGRE